MQNLSKFIDLLEYEKTIEESPSFIASYSSKDVEVGFGEIIELSGIPIECISFAHICGSYSREEQTAYSDIDIECFSPNMEEYQDTFTWNNVLVSFSIFPIESVRGENSNIIDRSWARSCFKGSKVIYDPNSLYREYQNQFIEDEEPQIEEFDLGFKKNLRKVVEYRRKMLNAVVMENKIFYAYSTAKFLENYTVVKNILVDTEISSEKGQFEVLAETFDSKGKSLKEYSEELLSSNISVQDCLDKTIPFFDDLIEVSRVTERLALDT